MNSLVLLVPFVLLAVGIDDMIVIVTAYNKRSNDEPDQSEMTKTVSVIKESGSGITITSFTTIMAYIIGALTSNIPGVQSFCVFAAIAFFVNYIYQFLVFIPLFIYDNKRITQKRNFCLPCFKHEHLESQKPKFSCGMEFLLLKTIMPMLNNKILRKIIVAIFLIILPIFGVYSMLNITISSQTKDFLPVTDDSYLLDIFDVQKDSNNYPAQVSIVLKNQNIYDNSVYSNILNLINEIETNPHSLLTVEHWLYDFEFYLTNYEQTDRNNLTKSEFYFYFQEFTNYDLHNKWDILFDDEQAPTQIKYMRLLCYFSTNLDPTFQSSWDTRNDYQKIVHKYVGDDGYAFYELWLFAYMALSIFKYSIISIIFSTIGVVIVLCYLLSVKYTILTAIIMILINLNVFTCMLVLNIPLNPLTYLLLITSIGLSVDYVLHVVHDFVEIGKKNISNNHEILSYLMQNKGVAVMKGCFTTLLGTVVLAFSQSASCRTVFYLFCAEVIVSIAHALIFVPAAIIEWNSLKTYLSRRKEIII